MKRLDLIIIVAAFAFGAISFLAVHTSGGNEDRTAEISVNGVLVESIRLLSAEPEERWIEGATGRVLVRTDSEGVAVIAADCMTRDCVHTGKITAPGQIIVCLPNRILIRMTGDSDRENREMGIDAFVR